MSITLFWQMRLEQVLALGLVQLYVVHAREGQCVCVSPHFLPHTSCPTHTAGLSCPEPRPCQGSTTGAAGFDAGAGEGGRGMSGSRGEGGLYQAQGGQLGLGTTGDVGVDASGASSLLIGPSFSSSWKPGPRNHPTKGCLRWNRFPSDSRRLCSPASPLSFHCCPYSPTGPCGGH